MLPPTKIAKLASLTKSTNMRQKQMIWTYLAVEMLTQQKTVNEYDQRQYSVNDLQREKLLENSRFVYSKINSCHGQRPYNGI
jgi:hypothetical protein